MKSGLSSFLQHRFSIFLYILFGWNTAKYLIFIFGYLYYLFHREERARIEASVEEVMSRRAPPTDVSRLKKDVLKGIFSHYYEKLNLAFGDLSSPRKILEHCMTPREMGIIKKALDRGKGVIMVSGHYGAIEYIPFLMALNGLPVSMIAKFKTPALKKQAFERAAEHGVTIIDGAEKGGILQCAIDELRKNRILITQCDEISEWRPSRHEAMTFLGKNTEADRTLSLIHKRTGAAIIFAVLHRESLKSYRLVIHDCDEMRMMFYKHNQASIGTTVLKCLENYIYRHPEQWYEWKKYPDIGGAIAGGFRGITPALSPAIA
jgi:lauroyl/myristoyl acyltransferase